MTGWGFLLPEGLVALTAGAVLAADLVLPRVQRRWLVPLVLAGVAAALAAVWGLAPSGSFGGAFSHDPLAVYLKTLILAALGAVVLMSWDPARVQDPVQGESLVLLMSASLGMMVLASGTELVLLYVGLELATFPLVLLTASRPQDPRSAEGGLKYLILATLGSAILLFGFSLLYAACGVTRAPELAAALAATPGQPLALLGLLCVLAGVGFKIALVPFHLWAPDAYEAAPTPVTAFLSVAGKTAGFALALRLLVGALPALRADWVQVLAALSAVTMLLGNLAAYPQTDLKRLLAYSSIAQAGYLSMGLVAYHAPGLSALLYYLAAYLVTNLTAFGVVIALERTTGTTEISAYAGLAQRSPRLALALLLALLSLAGIPPLAGFTAKFTLFAAAYGQGYGWLVLLAVLNSALSLYYYLRVVRMMYIQPPTEGIPASLPVPWPLAVVLLVCLVGVVLLGAYPGPFVDLARAALPALP